ncbi:heavy metal translocating P-type ATPase [Benzoatithermus flavus]|uniref:Heavy metal translocating P-type ATPase n=1 Tax=Benzoatithermus flavus TaxID=3108223 RepID=A0ABU8XY17_9PROT
MLQTIEREPATRSLALPIRGMTCAGCARRVEKALQAVPGVRSAAVNLMLERAEVVLDPAEADEERLVETVRAIGYEVPVVSAEAEAAPALPEESGRAELLRLVAAAALTLPLLLPMLLGWLGWGGHLPVWLELALATPVQLVIGARFYRGAWQALRARSGNMDVLVALGTSAAYFYSLWLVLRHGHVATGHLYFEAAAVVITLVLLGKWLEARAKRGASAALRELMALRPATATVLRAGREVSVPVAEIRRGDIVVVRPGERIAVDGTVTDGVSEIDESLLTGESMPMTRGPGEPVVAGSINGPGRLKVRAERLGADTTLARITALVEQAQMGKAPIQRLVDRVSGIFVPVVIAIATLTFLGWLIAGGSFEQAMVAAVSVLVIACPCALGLATPAALVAGTGVAARAGILIKSIETLERAHAVRTIVFDKTGTLTRGKPEVGAVVPVPGGAAAELLRLAASAQRGSEHPLGRAVVRHAEAEGLVVGEPTSFTALPGRGLEAEVAGHAVLIGTADLMAGHGIAIGTLAAEAEDLARRGDSIAWVAVDGRLAGLIGLRDAVRPEAAAAVRALARQGIASIMLSGDHHEAALRVAKDLGIAAVRAPVRPEDKAAEVMRLRRQGHVVAMVGDGVNDAPALAAADVGIAMGTGADVALETAGITLMRPDPLLVPAAIDIARRTWAKIRQNLFWAFVYNVVALPLAAMGLLTPALAGAAMALSSVSVVTNALTLRRWRPPATTIQGTARP